MSVRYTLEPMPDQPWRKDVWAIYEDDRCVCRCEQEIAAWEIVKGLTRTENGSAV